MAGRPSMKMDLGRHVDTISLVPYDLVSGQSGRALDLPARERFVTKRGGNGRVMGERPFGCAWSAAATSTTLYLGTGKPFDVLLIGPEGQPVAFIRRRYAARPVTRRDQERYVAWRTSRFRGPTEFTERARRVLSSRATPYPSTMPAYSRMLVDEEGYLWVREYDPPWEVRRQRWAVFQPGGRWLGTVATPAGVDVLQVGTTFVLGVARDSLDRERVVRFGLRRRP